MFYNFENKRSKYRESLGDTKQHRSVKITEVDAIGPPPVTLALGARSPTACQVWSQHKRHNRPPPSITNSSPHICLRVSNHSVHFCSFKWKFHMCDFESVKNVSESAEQINKRIQTFQISLLSSYRLEPRAD